ncbi:hypothetical protein POKO110462_21835 [Pontibacter korlensis]|uniref:Uncharacterized protein n=1 Tax=Pontibacter korlensis TaxID=400092 RepID=A0A0E3UV36_9BACT|nr:hypothetical protein [Pontibacter korlensis]AKD02172.1 hypothetical protein PKOR_02270 [Pontibacter korlensis]
MADFFALLIELLKLCLPALVLVGGLYYLLQKHYEREDRLCAEQAQQKDRKGGETITSIRLQAYERIVLLLERITPSNLLLRVSPAGQTAAEYHRLLLSEIRNEFNHNMSQQVYMSEQAWQQVNHAREDVVTLINKTYQELPENARGTDLAKRVLETVLVNEQDPTARAINFVKQEVRETF